jgi:hypothetical protein
VVDIRNPAQPESKEFITIAGANNLAVQGNYLYVSAGGGGFRWSLLPNSGGVHIYDISDPTRPKHVHQVRLDNAQAVTVAGQYGYLLAGDNEAQPNFHVLDLANPARPRLAGVCGPFQKTYYSESSFFMVPNGEYVYLFGAQNGARVIHVADPEHPRVSSTLDMQVNAASLAGECLMVGQGYGGLVTLDISNPAHPSKLGDPPGYDTIGYMKRRARRKLRHLAKTDTTKYAEVAYAMLAEPLKDRRDLNEHLQWVTMDTVFGRSERYREQGHGRHGYKLIKPGFVFRKREDRSPDAWNARPDLALKLFTAPGVSWAVQEFALKVLWQTKTPVPSLNQELLLRFLEGNSLPLKAMASRSVAERLEAGETPKHNLVALAYFWSNPATRRRIEAHLERLQAGKEFAEKLVSLMVANRGKRLSPRATAAALLLSRRFGHVIPVNNLRNIVAWLLESPRPELMALARYALIEIKSSEASQWISMLESCSDAARERGVVAMEEGLRSKAFSYQDASNLIHGYYYFYEYLGHQVRTEFYWNTAWRLLLAATATKDNVIAQIGREVLSHKTDAPALLAALQSPAALILMTRIPENRETLLKRLQEEPRLAALLTPDSFAQIVRNLSGAAMLALTQAATDARWAELRQAFVAGLRESGQVTAFWRAVFEGMPGDKEGILRRRLLDDTLLADTFFAVEDTEFFRSSDPTFEQMLYRWAQVHSDFFTEGSTLLIHAATHPLPEVRNWGLARAQSFGLTLPFALRLLESEVPPSVAVGKTFFEAVPTDSPQAFDYTLALCDSPKATTRQYGMEYAEKRWNTLPTETLLSRLGENSVVDVQTFVASKLLSPDAPRIETNTFDREVLRARHRGRRAKEMVKQRVEQAALPDIAVLLDMARSRTPRDAEWAMQQLARLALEGVPIEGFALIPSGAENLLPQVDTP